MMVIKVEFLAGTTLTEALYEARAKARMFNIAYIQFKFNGTDFSIGKKANIEQCLADYPKEKFIVSG